MTGGLAKSEPLAALTTRADDDPTVALIDAWACALDVLTFYQERIANEGFLRTATERRSVLELARSIGYELSPGVAASTRLAFTLLDTPNAPDEVELPAGLQIQSVPGPGQRPQMFETTEAITARTEWNAMRPVRREAHALIERPGRPPTMVDHLYLAGITTGLKVGDRLLVVGAERLGDHDVRPEPESNVWDFRVVIDVVPDKKEGVTRVRLDKRLGWTSRGRARWISTPAHPRVFAFGRRVNVFGHSAADPRMFGSKMKTELSVLIQGDEWTDFRVAARGTQSVHVVGELGDVLPGSLAVFEDEDYVELYVVADVELSGCKNFGLSLKTTKLTLDTDHHLDLFEPRTAAVHLATRELALGTRAMETPISGNEIVLEDQVTLFNPGRAVIVQGPLHGVSDGRVHAEVAIVARAEMRDGRRTVLKLTSGLANEFERASTIVLGNVARATHGKKVPDEVLGSGDGSATFQSFSLRQSPLTFVSSPSGTASTLTVRVGGVTWAPAPSTHGLGPDDRVYVPRLDDDGVTRITFGDGRNGARLPTGSENVTASYRSGSGASGAVDAGTLTVLKTRPQGVKAVTNPLPATGAAEPETLANARQNAPVTVLTFDRLVSLRDYEDYARAYPGIGKAQAVRLWDGRRWWVHLTLATSEGAQLLRTDDLYASLTADIDARRDRAQHVMFDMFARRNFELRGTVRIDPDYLAEAVLSEVRAVLVDAFSFDRRAFGQSVTGAEIVALAHAVPGLVMIDLDALQLGRDDFLREPLPTDAWSLEPATPDSPSTWMLQAYGARWLSGQVKRADLLLLDGLHAVDLTEARRG